MEEPEPPGAAPSEPSEPAKAPYVPAADAGYAEGVSPFRSSRRKPLVQRTFPVAETLPTYGKATLSRDVAAGLTVGAIALPAGMAYAELAGLPPVAGLYALLAPVAVYTLLGSSRQLVVGPEAATAVLVAAAVAPAAADPAEYAGLAAMLALLVGGVFLVARALRLGWIADYLPRPVLVGYIHGIAVTLIVGQVAKVFRLDIVADSPLAQVREILGELDEAHVLTAVFGLGLLAVLLLLKAFAPRWPGPLLVVVVVIALSAAFDLEAHGMAVLGEIPSGLPGIAIPRATMADTLALVPAALGIFFVSFSGSILTARSFAGRRNQHVRANQELLAFGLADLAAGFTQAFPVNGSGSRTAVNDQMEVRTQVSGLVAAAFIAVVLLVLTAPMEAMPSACLGAIIVFAALGMIDPAAWKALAAVGRRQVALAAVTTLGVITVGVLDALIIAVALSILDVVVRSARPHDAVLGYVERMGRFADVTVHPSAKVVRGVVVYRLDDRLFFANADYVKGRIREAIEGAAGPVRWFVFDAESVPSIDASGVEALEELVVALAHQDVVFVVARAKTALYQHLEEAGVVRLIGPDNFFPTVQAAVESCRSALATAPDDEETPPPGDG